jgi:hypothetical protein
MPFFDSGFRNVFIAGRIWFLRVKQQCSYYIPYRHGYSHCLTQHNIKPTPWSTVLLENVKGVQLLKVRYLL